MEKNISETAMQRYKKIIGNQLQSRKFTNQRQEMLIGCSILLTTGCLRATKSLNRIKRQPRLSITAKPIQAMV
ncbi:hypothetical protein [Vibrio genomosp. F6]|uniref:hypothetical protein n=1 Tax=Vibrio genomosp. F6 TaxID=723172 RepID=UPI00037112FA|nr:hypothetical protein [Vibrio genomosp. F6]